LEDLETVADADTLVSYHDFARFTLNDQDPQVRLLSIRLLWDEEDKAFIPVFIQMMQSDEDHQVRATAASALGVYVYKGEIEELPEDTLHLVEDRLLDVTQGEDHMEVRRRALESLGFSSRPEVPDLIEHAYNQGTLEWIASAFFAMGRSADQRWQQPVLDSLDHPSDTVRLEAVRAAGELELTSARQFLMTAAYKDEDEDVRHAAIWSLSQVGGDQVQRLLDRMLEKADEEEEIQILEDALDNLSFTNDLRLYNLIEVDEEGIEEQEEILDDLDDD